MVFSEHPKYQVRFFETTSSFKTEKSSLFFLKDQKNITKTISILGSSANCNQGSQNANALTNKYCGSILNPMAGATVNVPICGKIFDCMLALAGMTESTILV